MHCMGCRQVEYLGADRPSFSLTASKTKKILKINTTELRYESDDYYALLVLCSLMLFFVVLFCCNWLSLNLLLVCALSS